MVLCGRETHRLEARQAISVRSGGQPRMFADKIGTRVDHRHSHGRHLPLVEK